VGFGWVFGVWVQLSLVYVIIGGEADVLRTSNLLKLKVIACIKAEN
jgi:hypothetical protein